MIGTQGFATSVSLFLTGFLLIFCGCGEPSSSNRTGTGGEETRITWTGVDSGYSSDRHATTAPDK